jgi:hypothetical protein
MKNIKDLTENDCIHCRTQEEWVHVLPFVARRFDVGEQTWERYKDQSVLWKDGTFGHVEYAEKHGYTIHPASDFLTPQVSVLTEIGDCKVIKNGGDVIVMTGNVVITLTPPVLKHIQELLNQQQ